MDSPGLSPKSCEYSPERMLFDICEECQIPADRMLCILLQETAPADALWAELVKVSRIGRMWVDLANQGLEETELYEDLTNNLKDRVMEVFEDLLLWNTTLNQSTRKGSL